MDRPSAQYAPILNESDNADTVPSSDENDNDEPLRPRHDVAHVADYPMRSSQSSLKRDGDRGASALGLKRSGGGGAGAVLVMDDECPPDAFSAGLPGGIQLAQLLDPRNVREATAAPDAHKWKDATGKGMANLKAHDV